jgi:anti-sigma regulatory factor (Ser/Thr protein kinase)
MPTTPIAAYPPAINPNRTTDHLAPPLRIVLPAIPEAVGVARHLVRSLIGEDHSVVDSIVLCVSELVTNAVEHSLSGAHAAALTLCMHACHKGVVIQVRDAGGPTEPRLTDDGGPEAEHGYGLLLVDALADGWGTSATADGRVTWCRFNWRGISERR